MTKDEYDKSVSTLNSDTRKKLQLIRRTYAMSNNIVEVGDIIQDSSGRIIVEQINYHIPYGREYPECSFFGTRYTRKMNPYKSNDSDSISQCRIIKHIKKESIK